MREREERGPQDAELKAKEEKWREEKSMLELELLESNVRR